MEYAVIFLPLVGSILGFLGKSLIKYFSEITTSLFVSISAVFSIILFWNGIQNNTYGNFKIFEWISSGNFVANWSINIDHITGGGEINLPHLPYIYAPATSIVL